MKNYHGVVSVGLLTSKINFEGPIIKNRTSFNISARRSYIDLLAKPFMPKDEKYSYYFLMSMPRSTISSLIAAACSSVHTMAKTIL